MLATVPADAPVGRGRESWPGERTGVTGRDRCARAEADAGSWSTHHPAGRAVGTPGKAFPHALPRARTHCPFPGCSRVESPAPTVTRTRHPWLTHDSGPGADPGSPEAGGAEVQGGDIAGDTRGGGIPHLDAGGEVPAPQLLAQLPAPLRPPRPVVAQHPPPPLVKDLDVPFARRGAGRQPPQGLGLGALGGRGTEGSDPRGAIAPGSVVLLPQGPGC